MKRILFISVMNGAAWGGSEEFWYRMAIWMSRNGYTVDCCFFDWSEGKEKRKITLKESGCTLHLLSNPGISRNYLHRLLLKARAKKQILQVVQHKYDLICVSQGGLVDVTYPMFNSMLNYLQKFALIYHNYNDDQVLSKTRKRKLYKWSHAAVKNMPAAERIFSSVQKIAGFQLPNRQLLINPITIPVQDGPSQWGSLNENGNYVWVVLAELDTERKAQDLLIKTLAAEKWKHRNWQLYLYGNGKDKDYLAELILSLNLQHKVFLEGHASNVTEVLSKTHLLLQITHMDAMPLSVTEAMNMARPCVVSNVGDMPLWIKHEESGYVVPQVAENAIDAVMEKAWSQKENWQQLGINAFAIFRQQYPFPYEPHYERLFASLINNNMG
ncbi:MAG: glycosyltransferase [Ferruginibacter sp.]